MGRQHSCVHPHPAGRAVRGQSVGGAWSHRPRAVSPSVVVVFYPLHFVAPPSASRAFVREYCLQTARVCERDTRRSACECLRAVRVFERDIRRSAHTLTARRWGDRSGARGGLGCRSVGLYAAPRALKSIYTEDPPRAQRRAIIYISLKVGHSTCTCLRSVTGEPLRWPSIARSVVGESLRRPSNLISHMQKNTITRTPPVAFCSKHFSRDLNFSVTSLLRT